MLNYGMVNKQYINDGLRLKKKTSEYHLSLFPLKNRPLILSLKKKQPAHKFPDSRSFELPTTQLVEIRSAYHLSWILHHRIVQHLKHTIQNLIRNVDYYFIHTKLMYFIMPRKLLNRYEITSM